MSTKVACIIAHIMFILLFFLSVTMSILIILSDHNIILNLVGAIFWMIVGCGDLYIAGKLVEEIIKR